MRPIYLVVMDLFVAQTPLLSPRNIGGCAPFSFCCPGHLFWLGNEVFHRAIPRIIDTVSSEVTKNIPLVLIPLVKWQCMKRLQPSTELKVYYCFRLQQMCWGARKLYFLFFFFKAWQDNWCVLWTSNRLQLAFILYIFLLFVSSRRSLGWWWWFDFFLGDIGMKFPAHLSRNLNLYTILFQEEKSIWRQWVIIVLFVFDHCVSVLPFTCWSNS